jgi:hypothetical protein
VDKSFMLNFVLFLLGDFCLFLYIAKSFYLQ